jgi:hypothetical protein
MRKPEKIMLTEAEKTALNELAGKVGCFARSGPTAGKPSFRVLLQDMAAGTFVLFDKRKPKKKKEWKTKAKFKVPGAPDWWGPWYGNAMGLEQAIKKSGMDRAGLMALGLKPKINEFLAHPDILVGKAEWPAPFLSSRPHWWWMPDEGNAMDISEAVEVSGMTAEQIAAGGLLMDEVQFVAPDHWVGWRHKESPKSLPPVDPMTATPDWFVRLPKMMAMPLTQAIESSGMDRDEMELHGLVIKKINGQQFVSGPPGSEWADSDDSAAPAGDIGEILSMMVEDESQPEKVKSGRIKKS